MASILIGFPVEWARLRRMYSRFISRYWASNFEELGLGVSDAMVGNLCESKSAERGQFK